MSEGTEPPHQPEVAQPGAEPAKPQRSRRRRILKALAIVAALCLIGVAVLFSVTVYYAHKYDNNVDRIEGVFAGIPDSTRPTKKADTGENFLLVGSDIRAKEATTGSAAPQSGGGLSDVLMVIHVTADKKAAYVISIPRDSWVDIPGRNKNYKYKINGAYSLGGPPLVVQTVEKLTGIRIDHYLAIDMRGFAAMTDAVGGVDINVPIDSFDSINRKRWKAGPQRMDGETALLFVRQRYGLPNSDFDRIKHQHLFLQALMAKTTDSGQLGNPVKLTRLLNAVSTSLSVDSGLSAGGLRALAFSLRGLRGSAVHFLTVPVKGFGRVGKAAVVFLDPVKDEVLFKAVRIDDMASYNPTPAK